MRDVHLASTSWGDASLQLAIENKSSPAPVTELYVSASPAIGSMCLDDRKGTVMNPKLINTFQSVPAKPCFAWTDELENCIEWVRNPTSCPARQAYVARHLEPVKKNGQANEKAKKSPKKKKD